MGLEYSQITIKQRYLPHWELGGSIYHVAFSTWEKLELTSAAREIVLNCCLFFDQSQPKNIAKYHTFTLVVMPDHVHWLMQPLQKSESEYWSLSSKHLGKIIYTFLSREKLVLQGSCSLEVGN